MILRPHNYIIRRTGFGVEGADRIVAGYLILPRFQPISFSDLDEIWTMEVQPLSTFQAYLYGLELLCNLACGYEKEPKPEFLTTAKEIINSYVHFRQKHTEEIAEFSLSTGIVNIIHCLHLFDENKIKLTKNEWTALERLLRKDADFLLQDENYKYSNHGIWQDLSLLSLCLIESLEDMRDAYISTALRRIDRQIRNNFTSEFINVENSPFYHYYNLNLYQYIVSIVKENHTIWRFVENNDSFRSSFGVVDRLLEDGRTVLFHMMKHDGTLPCIGDSEGIKINKYRTQVAKDSAVYPTTGLAYLRQGKSFLALQAGVRYTGHKHYDDCAFLFDYDGVPILIDSGKLTYEYNDMTNAMHSVTGHNLVFRNGHNYKIDRDVNKYVLPDSIGKIGLKKHKLTDDADLLLCYNHCYHEDGFTRALIWLKPNVILLIDSVYDTTESNYTQNFNIGVGFEGVNQNDSFRIDGADLIHKESGLRLFIRQHRPVDDYQIFFGDEKIYRGLSSVDFGKILHNYNLSYSLELPPSQQRFVTTACVHGKDSSVECHIQNVTCQNNAVILSYYKNGHDFNLIYSIAGESFEIKPL